VHEPGHEDVETQTRDNDRNDRSNRMGSWLGRGVSCYWFNIFE
jgi:hypothetical protein